QFVYGRLDFIDKVPEENHEIVVNLQSWASHGKTPRCELRLESAIEGGRLGSWKVTAPGVIKSLASETDPADALVALGRNFEFRLPLAWLQVSAASGNRAHNPRKTEVLPRLRLRSSLWSSRLPVDALPVEGWIELELVPEEDLTGH